MKPYLIADTTYNHEGDIEYLLNMVDEVAKLGLNAVKFHLLFDLDEYMSPVHPSYQKIKGMLIAERDWTRVIGHAAYQGLDVVALCDDTRSMRYAMRNKYVSEIELHSSGVVDKELLSVLSGYEGDVMLGVGGATMMEIDTALSHFDKESVTLMYGFNGWPTDPVDIQLKRMQIIHNAFGVPVGYADHTRWDHPYNLWLSCAAALNGFPVLEKHYTLTPGVERVDYREAVGFEMMRGIRDAMFLCCGVYGDGVMSKSERVFARKIRKVNGVRR